MINRNRTDPERLHYLVRQYISNACSEEELEELLSLVREDRDMQLLQCELKQHWDIPQVATTDDEAGWDERFDDMVKKAKVESRDFTNHSPEKRRRFTWMAAASFLIILMAGYYWHNHNPAGHQKPLATSTPVPGYKNDIAPGGNKAMLTLANGAKIILDSAQNGQLASQGNVKVMKIDSGILVYRQQFTVNSGQPVVQYNTLSTPRGGQYQLVLPDGSKVWLNAASSIRYPTVFAEKERKVEITGEAYFEVTHNPSKPFKVYFTSPPAGGGGRSATWRTPVEEGAVEVLGTHFNVNAYEDETAIKVTLLEGSVKVSRSIRTPSRLILPGQQAILNKEANDISIASADTEEAVAWKNGFLQFNNSSLKIIMRQISRWYDVDISYEGDLQERFFTGKISRNLSLSNVLKILAFSNVHFKIEGRKITVIS
ncbi:MAG TPA: FecR domain-containing protein [Chitinophagaceae bacterium]